MIRHMIVFDKDNKPPESKPARAYESDTVTIDGVEVKNDPEIIKAFNQARAAATARARDQEAKRQQRLHTGKLCPLYKDLQTVRDCTTDCALYVGDSCALTAYSAERDTVGKPCPFMRQCTPSCAFYNGGCTLTNIMGMKPGKKV